jgi:hypothetical protein
MAGGILQLVANTGAVENIWINGDPQITFFKVIYRRHTPFASELVPIKFNTDPDFGTSANLIIPSIGDLVYRTFFVFDIPKLAAAFINTKSHDLQKIVKNTILTDDELDKKLKQHASNENQIEFDRILNLINETFDKYGQEENFRLAILDSIERYRDPVNIYIKNNNSIIKNVLDLELETNDVSTEKNMNSYSLYDFTKFKMDLTDQFINQKKQYYLVYEFLKFIYLFEKEILERTPLVNPSKIIDKLLYENIFNDLIPNKEILLIHHLKFATEPNKIIMTNMLDTQKLIDKLPKNDISRDFGYGFHSMLNTYNAIITAVKRLAKTVPIVIVKAFDIGTKYNIYSDTESIEINSAKYPTIIDPNFKNSFMIKINNEIPINLVGTFEHFYSTPIPNAYVQFFNDQSDIMFNNIRRSMENIFETYRPKLFSKTETLFFNNSAPVSNIYGLIIPTNSYYDDSNLRIKNVFNANIWFFYFFKYLDYLDEIIFAKYVADIFPLDFSKNSIAFLKNLVTLLKINIEYYMYEISYLVNDLYASTPSTNPLDNMKNYIPIAYNTIINGVNIHNDLLAVTFICHRSHVPTIYEIFEYINRFISNVDLDIINKNLDIKLKEFDTAEFLKVKLIVKLLYNYIFKYFVEQYNDLHSDNMDGFTVNNSDYGQAIKYYVRHFLVGDITDFIYPQISISKTLAQMEFYFMAEMINMRQQQNFYGTIFNKNIIEENVGSTSSEIVHLINQILEASNSYYQTDATDRFKGESYVNTPYLSRNYGIINEIPLPPPIPLPPTFPFGINPDYYDHNQITIGAQTQIPVYWITSNDSKSYLTSNSNNFTSIDYFRIKHNIFYDDSATTNNIKFINDFQINFLKLIKLTEYLNQKYSENNIYVLYWIQDALSYLINYFNDQSIINLLVKYLNFVKGSINENAYVFPPNFLSMIFEEMKKIMDDLSNQMSFSSIDLLTNNTILKKVTNYNIIDALRILRDNFMCQYYYYVLFSNSIQNIGITNIDFNSSCYIYHALLSNININNLDLSILGNYQENVFLYPEIYPTEVDEFSQLQYELDDFSRYISKILANFLKPTNSFSSLNPSNLTELDVYDIVNMTFLSVKEIYNYSLVNQQYDQILNLLEKYQKIFLDKLELFGKIKSFVYNLPLKKIRLNDLDSISKIAERYGIDYKIYYDYLNNENNDHDNLNIFLLRIKSDLDYYLSGLSVSLKNQIINELFTPEYITKHNRLIKYFMYVDNDYYPYIYFFLKYAKENNLLPNHIKNPLMLLKQSVIHADSESITNYYNSFTNISDFLEYLMDYLMDYSLLLCDQNPTNMNNHRFSININFVHKKNQENTIQKINLINEEKKFISDNDRIKTIIKALDNIRSPDALNKILLDIQTSNLDNEYYFDELDERSKIIELATDTIKKGIILLQQQNNELQKIKNQVNNILYRNTKAKTAWIRKLAHFLLEEASIKIGDQIINIHNSDWFESYHEISKYAGIEPGYLKMIGHRNDLITFDDKTKESYTIVMPLIFYFNKNTALSLPLNASINTKYQISIKLRKLDEVTYKEEFSSFVFPDSLELANPSITKAHLMMEYIYLSVEERKLFVEKKLEYLIDELQYNDTFNISDNNLVPIYKIGTTIRTRKRKKNGININEKYYDVNKGIYIDQASLDSTNYGMDLIPRNDNSLREYTDRTGVTKKIMVYEPLPNTNPYVHKKRIELENYFIHPSKLMIVLIKPLIHTDPSYRINENNYFYGERQWDNYGLYSYYDLGKITKAKEEHQKLLIKEINNLENPIYGFVNLINQILLEYTVEPKMENNKWINENYNYFLEILQIIKDAYNNFNEEIFNRENTIRLKENILSLEIDYHILDLEVLMQMVDDILNKFNISIDHTTILKTFSETKQDSRIDLNKNDFIIIINNLLERYVDDAHITQSQLGKIINSTYNNYNNVMINLFVDNVSKKINVNDLEYNLENLITYFDLIYFADKNLNENIVAALTQIKNKLHKMDDVEINNLNITPIKNLTYKDVIDQIINPMDSTMNIVSSFRTLVPYQIIQIVSSKMTEKQNQNINNRYISLINYHDNMISNSLINPLLSGYLKFNGYNIMPENSNSIMWSEATAYQYTRSTPSTGINLHSWSLDPLSIQPQGAVNLSKIDNFNSVYEVHPLIGNKYPAIIITFVQNINIMRYLSGMCGRAWK